MYTANQVDAKIPELKEKYPFSEAAWELAKLCIGFPYIFGDRGQFCTPAHRRDAYASKGAEHPTIKSKCKNFNGTGACSGCKFFPGGKTRAYDCRGFTYWVLKQIYGWDLMGGGATSQWNTKTNWKAKGEIGTMPKDTLCCLFVKKGKSMSHTGFGINNETIECSSGVQYFTKRNAKWTHWGVPVCVQEEIHPEPQPEPPVDKPMLKRGSVGEYVKLLQKILIKLGYDLGGTSIDGKFGKKTENAVKKFQKSKGLVADGIVGPLTWTELDKVAV